MGSASSKQSSTRVNIAISRQRLAELLDAGSITVSDIQCLDAESKREVWRTCLETSLRAGC